GHAADGGGKGGVGQVAAVRGAHEDRRGFFPPGGGAGRRRGGPGGGGLGGPPGLGAGRGPGGAAPRPRGGGRPPPPPARGVNPAAAAFADRARRQPFVHVVVHVHGQAELLEVVLALGAGGRRPHLLHRRHQQADQHRDDGDDHQQLDQGKRGAPWGGGSG